MMNLKGIEKQINQELKETFPNTTFESERYQHGETSSIIINWTDFPIVDEVKKVIDKYEREGLYILIRQDLSIEMQKKVREHIPFEKFNPLQYAYWERQLLNEWYEKTNRDSKVSS